MRGGKMESRMAKRCMKAFGSGVSSKRVRSKRGSIDFNKSSLPRRAKRRTQSEPVKSDFHIPLRQ